MKTSFRERLEQLINSESMENGSGTPDFILSDYLMRSLENFDTTVEAREKWYGRQVNEIAPDVAEPENTTEEKTTVAGFLVTLLPDGIAFEESFLSWPEIKEALKKKEDSREPRELDDDEIPLCHPISEYGIELRYFTRLTRCELRSIRSGRKHPCA